MTHTPAPWTIREIGPTKNFIIETPYPEQRSICATFADNNVANAALIAAAPELLAALQKLLRAVDRMPSNAADGIADEARAAIAKATGGAT